jgi:hypothetical protein
MEVIKIRALINILWLLFRSCIIIIYFKFSIGVGA